MKFILNEVFDIEKHLSQLPNELELDGETVDAILEEAAKMAENVLLPLNQIGDEQGCRWQDGVVTTPSGFKEAFKTYCEAGWTAIGGHTDYGGQDLPKMLQVVIEEMMYATNTAFFLYSSLSNGAYHAIENHGSDAMKQMILPRLMSGEWCGTMCLTEAHAGTDLGLLKTKAEPAGEGKFKLTGSKIFITGGEHDLAGNIVHLVLAKLPDAPAGSRGISLFLVPKFLYDDKGNLGERNAIHCGSIEKKMGIKGSATCVMNLDGAEGYLIGGEHQGLKCMFTMMNTERLSIGLQGLGSSEIAYQNAAQYAKDRLQGKGSSGGKDAKADPIIVHPDVRRMLMTIRAYNEAMRAFAVWSGICLDLEKYGADEEERKNSGALVALLTPITKAFFSDLGLELSVMGQQVFGGHGYIVEWGMEQYVRDVRIAQIYEGTNGVQALDLTGRKLVANKGAYAALYFDYVNRTLDGVNEASLSSYCDALRSATAELEAVTQWIITAADKDRDEIGAASVDYLRLFGLNICGLMWLKMMQVAQAQSASSEQSFYKAKLQVGDFFFKRILPDTLGLTAKIKAGAAPVMQLSEEAF